MNGRKKILALIEGSLCIAVAAVLTKLNLFRMPQGGSVDLELVPIILFACRHGTKWGMAAGAVSGIVNILLGSGIFNFVEAILDYPLAYSFVGLAGIKYKILGLICACFCQLTCHVTAGVMFFAEYAPAGQSPFVYSLVYNSPVIVVKYVLSGLIAYFLSNAIEAALPSDK